MAAIEKAIFTNMCMIIDGNKVLVENRVKSWKGNAFPGGHLEPFESITHSVIREVNEETGLKISNIHFCGIKQWFENDVRNVCFLFKANTYEGEIKGSDEGNIFWMNINDLLNSNELAYSFKDMLTIFLENDKNELYLTCKDCNSILY